jgi:uncharacterized protein
MPYKCVHCGKLYSDGSEEVLKGCNECKGKFFFYIRQEQLDRMKEISVQEVDLGDEDKRQIEMDVREISGLKDEEIPVFLDFESVKVIRPGKYHIDLTNLFAANKPRVYKLEDGKYIIDLSGVKGGKVNPGEKRE